MWTQLIRVMQNNLLVETPSRESMKINLEKSTNYTKVILQYYYRYLNDKNNGNKSMFYMNGIYKYYYLEEIPRNWMNYCVNKNVII